MFLCMLGDFFQDGLPLRCGLPIKQGSGLGTVQDQPGHVIRTISTIRGDWIWPETVLAPAVKLGKRKTVAKATAEVCDFLAARWRISELAPKDWHEVQRMKAIPHLMALAPKTDVLQRPALGAGVNPKRENTLISAAKLASAGHYSQAVYPNRKAESVTIFQSKRFRANFCGPI